MCARWDFDAASAGTIFFPTLKLLTPGDEYEVTSYGPIKKWISSRNRLRPGPKSRPIWRAAIATDIAAALSASVVVLAIWAKRDDPTPAPIPRLKKKEFHCASKVFVNLFCLKTVVKLQQHPRRGGGNLNTSVVHMRDQRFSKKNLNRDFPSPRKTPLNANFMRFWPHIYPFFGGHV